MSSSSVHRDGKLLPGRFPRAAQLFAACWQRAQPAAPRWCWRPASLPTAKGYLVLEGWVVRGRDAGGLAEEEEAFGWAAAQERALEEGGAPAEGLATAEASDAEDAAAMAAVSAGGGVHLYDFHVVFSPSYGVPVLYFRGYLPDGRELSWGALVGDLPAAQRKLATAEGTRWSFLTREEHPQLQRPWFALHPCQTAALLSLLGGIEAEQQQHQLPHTEAGIEAEQQQHQLPHMEVEAGGTVDYHATKPPDGFSQLEDPALTISQIQEAFARAQVEGQPAQAHAARACAPEEEEVHAGEDAALLRYMLAWCSVVPAALGLSLPAHVHTPQFQRAVLGNAAAE